MSVTAGEVLGFKQPGVGETVRLPVMLLDTAGDPVTGETFDAAGMTVEYAKEGASSFATFPTFDTNNWDEIGHGMYEVILRESDAAEKALLDTEGHLKLYVATTATRGDIFIYKCSPADVARDDQWTDGRAAAIDTAAADVAGLDGAAMRGTDGAATSAALIAAEAAIRGADSDDLKNLSDEIAGVIPPTVAAIADAVWDESIFDHFDIPFVAPYNTPAKVLQYCLTRLDSWLSEVVNDIQGIDGDDLKAISDQLDGITPGASAADVWAYGTRTLTAFEAVGADVWDYLLSAITTPASMGKGLKDLLELSGSLYRFTADALAEAPTGVASGSTAVTITLEDGDAAAIGGCPYEVRNAAQTTLQLGWTDTGNGTLLVNLDPGAGYSVLFGPLASYSFSNPYDLTVGAGPTQAETFTAIATADPAAPADPAYCRCYAYMRYVEGGAAVGAGDGTLDVVDVERRPTGATVVYADGVAAAATDAAGYVYIDIVRGADVQVRATWPDGQTVIAAITVPDADTYDLSGDLQA